MGDRTSRDLCPTFRLLAPGAKGDAPGAAAARQMNSAPTQPGVTGARLDTPKSPVLFVSPIL